MYETLVYLIYCNTSVNTDKQPDSNNAKCVKMFGRGKLTLLKYINCSQSADCIIDTKLRNTCYWLPVFIRSGESPLKIQILSCLKQGFVFKVSFYSHMQLL